MQQPTSFSMIPLIFVASVFVITQYAAVVAFHTSPSLSHRRSIGIISSTTTSSSSSSPQTITTTTSLCSATRVVWLTGHEDLRIRDHGGFADAISSSSSSSPDDDSSIDNDDVIVPVFIIDPTLHLRCKSSSEIARLHNSLSSLESELDIYINSTSSSSSLVRLSPLVIRSSGSSSSTSTILSSLCKEVNAISCHVIEDDVTPDMRSIQRETCNCLEEMGVKFRRWTNALRPSAPWALSASDDVATTRTIMPSLYPEYCEDVDDLPIPSPREESFPTSSSSSTNRVENNINSIHSEGIPPLSELIQLSQSVTPPAVIDFQKRCLSTKCFFESSGNTLEPYDELITNEWSTEFGVQNALNEYCQEGKDSFANRYFTISSNKNDNLSQSKSMYEAASNRILIDKEPSDVLALREAPTRAFSSALALGTLSARDVLDAARNRHAGYDDNNDNNNNNNKAGLLPSDDPIWGRSSEGALSDVVEWREWFRLLAERSLELQERGMPPTSGGEKIQGGDPREAGMVHYWKWKGQHLVRYLTWPAGKDYVMEGGETAAVPALLLVHGFAASAEQWERLVYSLRKQYTTMKDDGSSIDRTPPIFAVDLLGFGHSEKPGLSYTQYLWEAQLVDFAVEVMEAVPLVMVGNSIGGGISAGAGASLGKDICQGLVLCNTAGILEEISSYDGYNDDNNYKYGSGKFRTITSKVDNSISSHTEAALKGNPNESAYSPVPLAGKNALDLFGKGIIRLIYPQIEKRLSLIYGNRLENADPAVAYAIQQSANHPGSANVIGSGQKLAPNRPLNEVLVEAVEGGFDVLVVKGLNDQVSSPKVAQLRADLFSRLNPGKVVVEGIADAGHCPHDEKPHLVAKSIVKWLASIAS